MSEFQGHHTNQAYYKSGIMPPEYRTRFLANEMLTNHGAMKHLLGRRNQMIVHKFKIPNKNTLIWLGNQPIYGCDNVLVLAGGDVLFLKPVKSFRVVDIQRDMEQLSRQEFFQKYDWPDNSSGNDLYDELSKTSEYPGFLTP